MDPLSLRVTPPKVTFNIPLEFPPYLITKSDRTTLNWLVRLHNRSLSPFGFINIILKKIKTFKQTYSKIMAEDAQTRKTPFPDISLFFFINPKILKILVTELEDLINGKNENKVNSSEKKTGDFYEYLQFFYVLIVVIWECIDGVCCKSQKDLVAVLVEAMESFFGFSGCVASVFSKFFEILFGKCWEKSNFLLARVLFNAIISKSSGTSIFFQIFTKEIF